VLAVETKKVSLEEAPFRIRRLANGELRWGISGGGDIVSVQYEGGWKITYSDVALSNGGILTEGEELFPGGFVPT